MIKLFEGVGSDLFLSCLHLYHAEFGTLNSAVGAVATKRNLMHELVRIKCHLRWFANQQ